MALVRSWMSEALRAGLAGLAVPVALLAVLGVLALGGAFGGLSSLGQLFVGPGVPLPAPPPAGPPASPAAPGTAALGLPTIPSIGSRAGTPSAAVPHALHRRAPGTVHHGPGTGRTPRLPGRHQRPAPVHKVTPTPSGHAGGGGPSSNPNPTTCTGNCTPPPQQDPTQQLIKQVQQALPQVQQAGSDVIGTVQQLGSAIPGSGTPASVKSAVAAPAAPAAPTQPAVATP